MKKRPARNGRAVLFLTASLADEAGMKTVFAAKDIAIIRPVVRARASGLLFGAGRPAKMVAVRVLAKVDL